MQVNPSKHTKQDGIAYKGKVGDIFKCLQGCPADFTVKTCGLVPCVESQTQYSGFKCHEKNKLVSLQSELETQTLPKISEVAEKISTDCSEGESGPI